MKSEYYLDLLRALITKTRRYLKVDSDTALPIALCLFSELNKDRRASEIAKRKELVTVKQFVMLQKRFGITVEPANTTKQEASKLIQEQLRNGNNNYAISRNIKDRLATASSLTK